MSWEAQSVTEKHLQALGSPQKEWLPCEGAACTSLSDQGWHCSISFCLRQTEKNTQSCSHEQKTLQEHDRCGFFGVERVIFAGAGDLLGAMQWSALPSRQGWTHILSHCHEIILQVTAHSGRGGVFNPQGAALVLTNAGLESPALQSSWASPAHHCAPPVSAQSCFCWPHRALFAGERERHGGKNFCGYQNKIQTKRIQTKRQLTLQNLSLTAPKSSSGPDSDFSEYLWPSGRERRKGNHRKVWVGKILKNNPIQSPCHQLGYLPLDQVPCPTWPWAL